ncbi:dynein axonemal assembly factor 4-like [Ptychodera flava]|uniref:dynein axonemal assembly factor 4-like n=1 Tax=Ptychodera flava TaxID=63121 RepID=UPI00396A84BD
MPISIKDYTWDETETTVHITVPLKGVKASKADIFSTDEYIKVSFPPYLFEVALFASVDDGKGSAQVGNGAIVFNLVKREAGIWSRLTSPQSGDKEVMKSKREAAVEAAHRRAEKEKEEKAIKKREAEKYALKEQMALEQQEKKRIEETRNEERKKVMDELDEWKEKKRQEEEEETKLESDDDGDDDDVHENGDGNKGIFDEVTDQVKETQISSGEEEEDDNQISSSSVKTSDKKLKGQKKEETPVPAPRRGGSIEVSFTPRVFPTPQRESYKTQEEEWLRKQAEARKVGVIEDDSDLTEEEKNPDWLKDKGDKFYRNGNYLAAVNAYNQAIKLNRKLPSLYSNRAACHLQVGNLMKCIEDCSTALELLEPPVEANANSRLKAHIRRGTAFCNFELYVEGLQDYEAALKIDPNNEKLKVDADRIRDIIQGTEADEDSS